MKHYYIEQRAPKGKVIRRVPTTLSEHEQDLKKVQYFAPAAHKVFFVVSSASEKIIN